MFSLVSLMNGRMGLSQTMVGILASCNICKASNRSLVVLTFGSSFLHSSSSYVVSVICTTHLVFSLMDLSRSKSLSTLFDFVITEKPKPCAWIRDAALRTFPILSSSGIYGSVMEPVEIIQGWRLDLSFCSSSSMALALTSMSSKRWSM